MTLTDLREQWRAGMRMWRRARQVRNSGLRAYTGDPARICRTILRDCFDGKRGCFAVSAGHFQEFYTRDFAFHCEALLALGYRKEVRSTLEYALRIFAKNGRITTCISPEGVPFDFPRYAPDSLALLLYAVVRTRNTTLLKRYRTFLQNEVNRFARLVVDPATRLPYRNRKFSSIRDHSSSRGSCYDAVMVALVAREAARLGLQFPYSEREVRDAILATYWNGTYFFGDTTRQPIVLGHANVFPFWTGIVDDPHLREQAMTAVRAAGLDEPFPLQYVSALDARREKVGLHPAAWLARGYETETIWIHLGLAYLRVLQHVDPSQVRRHVVAYERLIRTHRTFLEVYRRDGTPYRTGWYVTDEAMSWCAGWLALKNAIATQKKGRREG